MSVSLSLNNALTGLNVNQQALTVLSQNIANANTPGYSKQIINQKSVSLNGVGEGVSIDSVTRKVDDYLAKAVQNQNSSVGQTSTINDYYSKIQLLLGTPGTKNSIDSYVNNFFNSVQSLSQTPDNTALQQNAVNNGVTVAKQFNQLAGGMTDLQFQADSDINTSLQTMNNDLTNIFKLNQLVAQNAQLGKSVADVQDQRDSYIKDLSTYAGISTFQHTDGSVFITTTGGVSILDENLYQFSYKPTTSSASFTNNSVLSPITVAPTDLSGKPIGSAITLASQDKVSSITTLFTTGKLGALMTLRNQTIPGITSQLDSMASALRDQVNTIHNHGTGYPGANSLTGTRAVFGTDYSQWGGSTRIAVLDSNGQPITSPYPDEPNGVQPLTLNLSTLDTGNGAGNPSVQGIINAINQFYTPSNKAEVGNLNNIQLVTDTAGIPNNAAKMNFDFDLTNISSTGSNFYVTRVTVTDNNGSVMNTTSPAPTVALDPNTTYSTQSGSSTVTVKTTGVNSYRIGQVVYLAPAPAGPDLNGSYSGIPASQIGGYVTVTATSTTGFQFTTNTLASADNSFGVAGQTASSSYASATPGGQSRTGTTPNTQFITDLSSNTTAPFYNVSVTVGVDDGTGKVQPSTITYQVFNNQPALFGTHMAAQTVTGGGKLVAPTSIKPLVTAKLVNADGVELPKIGGVYTSLESGFLQISAASTGGAISIDSLDSSEQGKPTGLPPVPASHRGFSHYFDLNDFFNSNDPIGGGDTQARSAANISVAQRIQGNNGLLSLGQLTQSPAANAASSSVNYTYQLNPGDNSNIVKLASLSSLALPFAAAGGLNATTQTFSGYAGQVIGAIATAASNAGTNSTNAQALYDAFSQKSSAVSGVNLDTELANTVIYQNAYAASARVITVANTLFDDLLQTFRG